MLNGIAFYLFIFKFFFWCGPFLKSIEFVTTLLLFYVLVFWLRGVWDLSSLTRDRTHTPCIGRQSLSHWTSREVPWYSILKFKIIMANIGKQEDEAFTTKNKRTKLQYQCIFLFFFEGYIILFHIREDYINFYLLCGLNQIIT